MKASELKVGDKINYLTMVSEPYKKENKDKYAIFRCDCGREKEIRLCNVVDPKGTKSCGCMRTYLNNQKRHNYKHGMCRTRLCRIWYQMRRRCNNPNYPEFQYYGGRGIKVCDEWEKDFSSFKKWAEKTGYTDELSIDRIDPDKGYSPDNCRWATNKEQCNNKRSNIRITYNGKTQTLAQWCEELNLNYQAARARCAKGASVEKILKVGAFGK